MNFIGCGVPGTSLAVNYLPMEFLFLAGAMIRRERPLALGRKARNLNPSRGVKDPYSMSLLSLQIIVALRL